MKKVMYLLIGSSLFFLLSVYVCLLALFYQNYIEFYEWKNLAEEAEVIVVEKEIPVYIPVEAEQQEDPVEDQAEGEQAVQVSSAVFKVTHYCGCSKCCGKWSEGSESVAHGSTGHLLTPFVSVAVDPKVIPYGTILWDEQGNKYIAEDCGGAIKGNRIDLFVGNHKEALKLGVIKEKTFYWEVSDESN